VGKQILKGYLLVLRGGASASGTNNSLTNETLNELQTDYVNIRNFRNNNKMMDLNNKELSKLSIDS